MLSSSFYVSEEASRLNCLTTGLRGMEDDKNEMKKKIPLKRSCSFLPVVLALSTCGIMCLLNSFKVKKKAHFFCLTKPGSTAQLILDYN